MTKHSKYNLVYRLQKWMDTVDGQTFLNYTYSWGASIVILGALFKLTHLPGANVMLFIGMGTEVFVFFISAFDRPFDKTADGRDMPTHMSEEFLASGQVTYSSTEQQAAAAEAAQEGVPSTGAPVAQPASPVWSQAPHAESLGAQAASSSAVVDNSVSHISAPVNAEATVQDGAQAAPQSMSQPTYVPQMTAEEAEALNEAQGNYVEELKELVETLKKVNEQSSRLTRDSEEMENLNRTLTGISKVYEMQLKGASQQIGTIDQINDQSRKMAQQIEQLNQIYARMIEAMTVNMKAAAPIKKEE